MFTGYRDSLKSSTNNQERKNQVVEKVKGAVHTLIDTVFSEDPSIDKENLEHQIQEIVLQAALLSDARTQSEGSKQNTHVDNEMRKLFGEKCKEILEKRAALQEKWNAMDDSDEKRDISGLIFVNVESLSGSYRAVLSDDRELFEQNWNPDESTWRRFLELSCLANSENVANFLLKQKAGLLVEEDYGYILSYITLSSNQEWAIRFSEQMKERGFSMPDCIYQFDLELNLIDEISNIFKSDHKQKMGL